MLMVGVGPSHTLDRSCCGPFRVQTIQTAMLTSVKKIHDLFWDSILSQFQMRKGERLVGHAQVPVFISTSPHLLRPWPLLRSIMKIDGELPRYIRSSLYKRLERRMCYKES
ncbi:hypothetical protein GLYMA_11G132050v4 [Glycine max]|nr:hypothetical protein GLYMA_11G132050v4 [Glycine max]KAH1158959.1 hypothetical protein GYH30_030923 [Glycine max]